MPYVLAKPSRSRDLRGSYSEESILKFVNVCFDAFMTKAISLAKGSSKVPMGKALRQVLQEESAIWNTKTKSLC